MNINHLSRNIKIRLFTSFYTRIVSVSIMPFMALFFADHLGRVFAGTFLLISALISFTSKLWGGYVADRNKRKTILIISTITGTFLMVLMTICLLDINNYIFIFAFIYLIWNVVSSIGSPALNALILDSTTKENRKRVYVISYWLDNIAISVGIAMGGIMYKSHRLELFILLSCALFVTSIIYVLFLQDNHVPLLNKLRANPFLDAISNYSVAIKDQNYLKYVIGLIFFFSAEFSVANYIGIRLKDTFQTIDILGFQIDGIKMMSAITIENTIVVVAFTFIITSLVELMPKQKAYLLGILIYGVGYAALNVANSVYGILIFGLFAVIGELICVPIHMEEQAKLVPDDRRASYLAFGSLSFSGGDMLGRFGIILGAYLIAPTMAIYTGIAVAIGAFLIYSSFYIGKSIKAASVSLNEDIEIAE